MVSTNGDAHVMRIRFLGAHFKNYFTICDLFAPLHKDVGIVDNFKSIYNFDALVVWYIGNLDYALEQSAKFIGV